MKSARKFSIIGGTLAGLVVVLVVVGVGVTQIVPTLNTVGQQRNLLTPAQGALLGINSNAKTGSGVSILETDANRVFDLDLSFHSFGETSVWSDNVLETNGVKNDVKMGRTPIFSWSPISTTDPSKNLMPDIAAGKLDPYLEAAARSFAAFGKPIMLRFAHEMNGDWYPWSGCSKLNGYMSCDPNAATEYVAAWRHVHDIFAAAGASNVVWIWCINGSDLVPAGTVGHHWTDFYPGDSYVDWVGIDKYFSNTTVSRSVAEASTLGTFLDFASPNAYNDYNGKKPIIIAETSTGGVVKAGASDSDYDKTAFFDHMVGDLAQHPGIKAVVIVDHNSGGHDYRVNNDNAVNFASFIEMVQDRYFGLRLKDAPQQHPRSG